MRDWPALRLAEWRDTYATLHLWTQVVGKIRLSLTPQVNHWWNVTLYVTPRGLTTSKMPYGSRAVQIDFDFLDHELVIESRAGERRFSLESLSVARFYERTMDALGSLEIEPDIWTMPREIPDPIVAFERDEEHATYDPEYAARFGQVLLQADRLFQEFRSGFIGKVSPVHYFWGAADLAVTRFSGRTAPKHPGGYPNVGKRVMEEAYSHEVSSAGFWPGGGGYDDAAFYAYAYPAPEGFADWPVEPDAAFYSQEMGEFLLPYDAVRNSADPDSDLRAFLQTTYEAAAELAGWDRSSIERSR